MPYPCLITCSRQISCRFHANFTQSLQRNRSGIQAESQWNRSGIVAESYGIHADSSYALTVLDSMKERRFHADFTQILRKFHGEFVAESQRNPSRIVAELFRNRSGNHAESIYALPVLDSMQHADFMKISRRFHANLTQSSYRNPSGIHAESIYALPVFDQMQPADFTQILRRFLVDFTQNFTQGSQQNPGGILAESFRNRSQIVPEWQRNPCGIYLCLTVLDFMQLADVMQISRRSYANFTQSSQRNLGGILADAFRNCSGMVGKSMPNLSMAYLCLIACSVQISCRFHADFPQILRRVRSGILAKSQRNRFGIVAESFRNGSGIHAESIYALSVLVSMQPADFKHIAHRFHANFTHSS